MNAVLLCAAGALLLWPGQRTRQRQRLRPSKSLVHRMTPRWRLPAEAAVLPLLVGGGSAALAGLLSTMLVAALAGGCTALAVRAWQRGRRVAADAADLDALTEGLGALAAELRSGQSLTAAIAAAAAAAPHEESRRLLTGSLSPPSGTEPTSVEPTTTGPTTTGPTTTGPTTTGRIGSGGGAELHRALERLSAAARLSARTGCSLAAVVGAVEDDLRARRRQRIELRSAVAGPRASTRLLAGLPVLGLAMGSGVGADPWGVLTTTGTGQLLLVTGVALEVAGVAWSGRLVQRVAQRAGR